MEILSILDKLKLLINKGELNAQFNPPADSIMINHVERAFDITLPESYKTFLQRFNGGLIIGHKLEKLASEGDIDTVRWNSFNFFSLEELVSHYEDCRDKEWKVYDFKGPYPYIPFASTPINEFIVFVNVGYGQTESPVFDAFHEEPASFWGILAPTFTEYLGYYVDSQGEPKTIGEKALKTAEELRWAPSEIELKGLEKPKAVIRRSTAYLALSPNDYYTYMERGNALLESGRIDEARADLNRAVELNPGFSYGLYSRSKLHIREEAYIAGLEDLDAAVDHAPDDSLYLTGRANLLLTMGEYQKALEDCNKAIEVDNRYVLAYMARKQVYSNLGDTEKATADGEIITELLSE